MLSGGDRVPREQVLQQNSYRPLTSYILTGLSVGHFMEERSSLKAGGEGGDWRVGGGGDWQVSLF